jgi:Mn-dependent DtxR family transcriptional regulator
MADQATVAEQEYLESLFWLFEAGFPMTGANLARAMRLSAPTVHEMLGRLERGGYIARGAGRGIEFTDFGREHAERVVGRHRMIERFLTDVVGVPWDDVHEEAEKLTGSDGETVELDLDGTPAAITFSVAETVSVRADPSPPPRTALPEQLVLGGGRYGR